MTDFTFTRAPSLKIAVSTKTRGAVSADNTVVLIGHLAAAGSSATAGAPVVIENFGDEVLAAQECEARFGANSEIGEMVLASIRSVKFSEQEPKVYPPITCLPLANADDDLAGLLANNINLPMPFVAVWFAASDAKLADLRDHLNAISASDRGVVGQFGSFGFSALYSDLATSTPVGESAASEKIIIPWLRDGEAQKANKIHEVAAAVAALAAQNPAPFNPLNEAVLGGLKVPANPADHHTIGDAGTEALGLKSGLTPLLVNSKGQINISRLVTSRRQNAAIEDAAYYDQMDWAVMYFWRKFVYSVSSKPRYKQTKNSISTVKNLRSELITEAKNFETQGMFQYVDKFVDQFTITRPSNNRHASVFRTPFNVVPGLHNIGVDAVGTDQFDEFEI